MHRFSGFTLPLSRLQLGLLSNFVGTGWSTLVRLAFVPIYIKFLGIEAYGLIGFYITLQGALQLLDFGISPTMSRELARYSVQPERASETRDFVRTLEIGYWIIGIAIGAAVYALAPFIATNWIKTTTIPISIIQSAVVSMGLASMLQWPLSFYQGGLLGLQKQTLLNGLLAATATLRHSGAALILWLISPTITAFFVWQIIAGAVQVGLITIGLWRSLPLADHAPRFRPALLKPVWRFATGMSGITISALILTQFDKVVLSKLLTLELFGYYTLASVVGNGLALIVSPVFNVVFPQLSALVAIGNADVTKRFYHRSAQLMAVIVLPVAAMLVFFAMDILWLWTGDAEVARQVAPVVSLLVIGSTLNSIMVMPYSLQLAYGWTSLGVRINIFLIICMVPTLLVLSIQQGPTGAAVTWVILNSLYLLIGAPLTYRRLLKGEGWRWFVKDVSLPVIGAILTVWLGRMTMANTSPSLPTIIGMLFVSLGALLATTLAAHHLRAWVWEQLLRLSSLIRP